MIDGSEKCNCQLAFELQNSHVCEKRSNRAKLCHRLCFECDYRREFFSVLKAPKLFEKATSFDMEKVFLSQRRRGFPS